MTEAWAKIDAAGGSNTADQRTNGEAGGDRRADGRNAAANEGFGPRNASPIERRNRRRTDRTWRGLRRES